LSLRGSHDSRIRAVIPTPPIWVTTLPSIRYPQPPLTSIYLSDCRIILATIEITTEVYRHQCPTTPTLCRNSSARYLRQSRWSVRKDAPFPASSHFLPIFVNSFPPPPCAFPDSEAPMLINSKYSVFWSPPDLVTFPSYYKLSTRLCKLDRIFPVAGRTC
jgi:hypothetical protein